MKIKMLQMIIVMFMFTAGCSMNNISSDNNENKDEINSGPINYETNEQQEQIQKSPNIDYTRYNQSQRRMAEFKESEKEHLTEGIYTNEETKRVTEHLKSKGEIVNAQVASTNDRIIVAVTLSDHGNQHLGNEIEQEVRTIVHDKEIIVYTDYTEWQQWKDEISSGGISPVESNIDDFLKKFFNVEMKKQNKS